MSRFNEPEEKNPVAEDWRGQDLYEGDKVYDTPEGYVLDDMEEIEAFIQSYPSVEL